MPQADTVANAPAVALDDPAFAALMARFAPFEHAPHLAVGVSGGADSLALALLAHNWAQAQGGQVTALTVDHGLRAESAAEAAQVGRWLGARGVAHAVLHWTGPKPQSAIQAQARAARRRLLSEWCRAHDVLHLLLAHQRDDQAETLLLRRQRDSGPDGLAAMAAVVELPGLRILRPLLGVAHDVLTQFLAARGQAWIEDPSNRNDRFTRTVLRRDLQPARSAALAEEARDFGRARAARERELATALAPHVSIHREGWAAIDASVFADADSAISRAVMARVLRTIGGGAYTVRGERLARLHAELCRGALGQGRTLGGCRLVPWKGRILVAREAESCPEMALTGECSLQWDGRFAITISPAAATVPILRLGPLGPAGWATLKGLHKPARALPIPHLARLALPAVKDLDGIREVPHLMYRRSGGDPVSVVIRCADFQPLHPLAGPEFATF